MTGFRTEVFGSVRKLSRRERKNWRSFHFRGDNSVGVLYMPDIHVVTMQQLLEGKKVPS